MTPAKTNILGVAVSAVNMERALNMVDGWISEGLSNYICCRDVHGLVLCQEDEELRRIHNSAGLVTPDGMPLVWLSRRAGHAHVGRVYGPDLMLALAERSVSTGYRHFFYGGAPGIPEKLADGLTSRFPGLTVAGCYSPPYRPLTEEENKEVLKTINRARPDIVWVGLSTPKQEKWMAANVAHVKGAVLIGVGAAFDFHAGEKRQAPRWVQRSGFEWFFRVLVEPGRLWRRYGKVIPLFVFHAARQAAGIGKYSVD